MVGFGDFHIIIPARYASTRLPAKLLLNVAGKPLIQRVYERALLCGAKSVTVATDDSRIKEAALLFGAEVCMTSLDHQCGTERLAEAAMKLSLSDEDIVVNIQGDEPLILVNAVQQAAKALFQNPDAAMATLCTPIKHYGEIFNTNVVKVTIDKKGYALYFSRAPIPWHREFFKQENNIENDCVNLQSILKTHHYFRHIGLYAYRVGLLKKYQQWGMSPPEAIEKLEQLRILWNGEKIYVSLVEEVSPAGVDTEEDLERVRAEYSI